MVSDLIFSNLSNTRGGTEEKTVASNRILSTLAGNLELLASITLARFIVWRELRRRKHEGRASV